MLQPPLISARTPAPMEVFMEHPLGLWIMASKSLILGTWQHHEIEKEQPQIYHRYVLWWCSCLEKCLGMWISYQVRVFLILESNPPNEGKSTNFPTKEPMCCWFLLENNLPPMKGNQPTRSPWAASVLRGRVSWWTGWRLASHAHRGSFLDLGAHRVPKASHLQTVDFF